MTLCLEQTEQRLLLRVIGLRRIARRRTDAAIFFLDQLRIAQIFIWSVGPEFLAHTLMHPLRQGLGQPVGQRL